MVDFTECHAGSRARVGRLRDPIVTCQPYESGKSAVYLLPVTPFDRASIETLDLREPHPMKTPKLLFAFIFAAGLLPSTLSAQSVQSVIPSRYQPADEMADSPFERWSSDHGTSVPADAIGADTAADLANAEGLLNDAKNDIKNEANKDAKKSFDPTEGATPMDSGAESDWIDSDVDGDDEEDEEEEPGLHFGGWLQQGITGATNHPTDGFNGVVGLNDRDREYQMNQLWLFLAKKANNHGCGWDWGGRIDMVYGTDGQRFQMLDGLEADWDQTNRFYQMALLRFFFDVQYDDWMIRTGKFDARVGWEPYEATEAFFYSKSYEFMYGTPGTLLGMMASRKLSDHWSINAGFHRGSDQFNDTDGRDRLDFAGGLTWDAKEYNSWVDSQFIVEENGPGDTTLLYSIAGGTKLTDKLEYLLSYCYGNSDSQFAEWYGILQYLTYEINDQWSAGLRFEWFRDDDGFVVNGFRGGNVATGPFVGNFYAITAAINYEPMECLALRPEIRYDWFNADTAGSPNPFDAGNMNHQLLGSFDVIVTF